MKKIYILRVGDNINLFTTRERIAKHISNVSFANNGDQIIFNNDILDILNVKKKNNLTEYMRSGTLSDGIKYSFHFIYDGESL